MINCSDSFGNVLLRIVGRLGQTLFCQKVGIYRNALQIRADVVVETQL